MNFPAEGTGSIESWETILKMAAFMSQRKLSGIRTLISVSINLSSNPKYHRMVNILPYRMLPSKTIT
jgi:hypothetical protein